MLAATDVMCLQVLQMEKHSDAKITEHKSKSNLENITEWFQENDVLAAQRSFRDAANVLKGFGIQSQMPHFLGRYQTQYSKEEANESRLVTKVRSIVVFVNGRVESWKSLFNTIHNSQIPYVGSMLGSFALCAMPLDSFNELREG